MCAIISDKSCSFFSTLPVIVRRASVIQFTHRQQDVHLYRLFFFYLPVITPCGILQEWIIERGTWTRKNWRCSKEMKSESARSEIGSVRRREGGTAKQREGATQARVKLIKHVLWMWQQGEVHSASFSLHWARNWKLLLVDMGPFLIFWTKDSSFKYPSQLDYHSGQNREISCYTGRKQ